ncbi:MAG: sodium-dependent bicarbonate transport family permease [Planctomycetota bacterium]|nr:sodium-dependent bicarbonate transport family permease [Planctomycetota bacterium]
MAAAVPVAGDGSGILGISPPVLFFALGVLASLVRSNLRMPKAITKGLSLYLMWAIGFKGGVELARDGLSTQGLVSIALALAFAFLVPLGCFPVLRRLTDRANAAALTAVYGSVSVVTFLTAVAMLHEQGIESGGHMVAAMTLMEFPAIVVGVALLRMGEQPAPGQAPARRWGFLLHESLLNGPVLLLLGSLTIGALTGEHGYRAFKPLCTDVFPGVLAFFLLDMGLLAAARRRDILAIPKTLLVFGIAAPVTSGVIALGAARACGVALGDGILLGVLAASASYIAAPAALRLAVPQAKPALYISLALGVTFPFNITLGIPLLTGIAQRLW